ncbi:pancreatic secretory granule membrane major glycoprotein GP2-like [Clinocottus analis]|uniref:pancreatic secretory granule membrane major glycoprotein GP2-like n=1 Tax=Clinocottus analis TaxID=304258 RepID=UPI0035BF4F2F
MQTLRCQILTPVCTVSGSSVIDFHGSLASIPDRCGYTLLKPLIGSDFEIRAGFLERRRTDVSHLDHVLIVQSNKKFLLGQGGTVVVEGKTLDVTTKQEVHGVKLSKDKTGVTAELLTSKVTVFFDGNTAHVSGSPVGVQGLCGNPSDKKQKTTAAAMKTLVTDCATLHKDAADSTIDCKSSTERCNLLKQAPFTAGHKVTDPQPFVDACKNTLCKYPAVDGLKCQFIEAYAESYRLKANISLGDWRSKVNCPVPKASCLQHHCSEHEFCGEKLGERHCFCRALFTSNYTDTLGEPAVCKKDSATVSLAGCLLQEKGIDYTVLHLKDPTCKGLMDKDTHMVTFSFNSSKACGTKVSTTDTQILYKNAIVTRDASKAGVITRHDQVNIDFSCLYKKPDITSVSFKIKDSSVVKEIVSGDWKYTLMMNAYADAGRTRLITKTTAVKLNQQIWVELKTTGLDGGMVSVVTDSCWATNEAKASSTVKYHLVKDGCPNKADGTVKMEGNGKGTSTVFSFNMFEFSAKKSEIYLHCKLELCITKGSKPCAPVCPSKRKRRSSGSKAADGNPALITMAWSN